MVGHVWRQIWSSRLNARQRRDFRRRFPPPHTLTGWCVTLFHRGVGRAAAAAAAAAESGLLHLRVTRNNVEEKERRVTRSSVKTKSKVTST